MKKSTEVIVKEVIRSWQNLAELTEFAIQRQSYSNDDGYFGIDYDENLNGKPVKINHIAVYAGYGTLDGVESIEILEQDYLSLLKAELIENNKVEILQKLVELQNKIKNENV